MVIYSVDTAWNTKLKKLERNPPANTTCQGRQMDRHNVLTNCVICGQFSYHPPFRQNWGMRRAQGRPWLQTRLLHLTGTTDAHLLVDTWWICVNLVEIWWILMNFHPILEAFWWTFVDLLDQSRHIAEVWWKSSGNRVVTVGCFFVNHQQYLVNLSSSWSLCSS